MIIKKEIPFSELNINKAEALRFAGVKGEADENTHKLYDKAYELLSEALCPKAVYKYADVSYTEDSVIIDGEEIRSTGLKKFGAMLGDFVEVGCNSVLNPGTVVGRNTNIYPLSSVRGTVPPNSIFKSPTAIVPKEDR